MTKSQGKPATKPDADDISKAQAFQNALMDLAKEVVEGRVKGGKVRRIRRSPLDK